MCRKVPLMQQPRRTVRPSPIETLACFIDSMARRVSGRMVSPELDDLGAAVVGSYLGDRSPTSADRASYRDFRGGWADNNRGFWAG